MPVQKQSIPIPLGALDTKSDPKITPAGQMLVVENAWRKRTGEYRKRTGWETAPYTQANGTSELPTSARFVANSSNSVLVLTESAGYAKNTGNRFDSVNPSKADSATAPSPDIVEVFNFSRALDVSSSQALLGSDHCELPSAFLYIVHKALNVSGVGSNRGYIVDKTTRNIISLEYPGTLGTSNVRCVASATYGKFYVLTWSTTRVILTAIDAAGSQTNLVNVGSLTAATADICVSSSGRLILLYTSNSGTTTTFTCIGYDDVATAFTNTTTRTLSNGAAGLSVAIDGTGIHFSYAVVNPAVTPAVAEHAIRSANFSASVQGFATVVSASNHEASSSSKTSLIATPNGDAVFLDASFAVNTQSSTFQGYRNSAGTVTFSDVVRGAGYQLGSRGLKHDAKDDHGYVVMRRNNSWDAGANAHFLLCGFKLNQYVESPCFALARLAPYEASVSGWNLTFSTDTNVIGESQSVLRYAGAISLQQSAAAVTTILSASDSVCLWTLFRYTGASSVRVEDDVYISGPTIMHFDGQWLTELNFAHSPNVRATTDTTGTLAAGTYVYAFVYRWTDSNGNIHRSAPYSVTVTLAAIGRARFNFFPLGPTLKAEVQIDVYRTEPSGSVLYYLATVDGNQFLSSEAFSSSTWKLDDTTNTITGRVPIYTSGGELPNEMPLGGNAIVASGARLFTADGDRASRVGFTRERQYRDGASSASSFVFDGPTEGGAFKALSSLDGRIILFKSSSVHFFQGRGPLANGQQNDFTPIIDQPSTSGCDSQRKLIVTNDGVFFQSRNGIKLLDRSMNIQDVGVPLERYNSSTVTGAVYIPESFQVRFYTSGGEVFVWDQYFKEWYVWTNHLARSVCFDGTQVLFAATNGILRRTTTSYSDNGDSYVVRYVLAMLQFGGIAGYQRIFRLLILGERRGDHTLQVQAAYDFRAAYNELRSLAANSGYGAVFTDSSYYGTTVSTSTDDGVYKIEFRPKVQRCESLMLLLQESSTTEGFTLSQITAEVGVLPGSYRNRAARRMQ
jgi:hypothetical protein